MSAWQEHVQAHLDELQSAGMLRRIRPNVQTPDGINLSDNDYLGLAQNRDMRCAFWDQWLGKPAADVPLSSSASPLLMGRSQWHERLENALLETYRPFYTQAQKSVLLFNSGWHANTGFIAAFGALFKERLLIVADRLVHASMIDGMRMATLSGSKIQRFAHNDLAHVRKLLERHAAHYEAVLLLTESVFSMDGDAAHITELCALKRTWPQLIIAVDEAHAVGVAGPAGAGLVAQTHCMDDVDIVIGTLGKALASSGAFVLAHPTVRAYLVNSTRSLIFSTADSPLQAAWSAYIVEQLPTFEPQRARLMRIAQAVRQTLIACDWLTEEAPTSWIVPIVLGEPEAALRAYAHFLDRGMSVSLVRPPTVPMHTCRIRLSLKASLTDSEVERLLTALREMPR